MSVTQTQTWFDITARANFEKHLLPFQPKRCLQLGCFTGDATMWMINNLPDVMLTDIDTFEGSAEYAGTDIDMAEVRKVYLERIDGYEGLELETLIGATDWWLRHMRADERAFDFIYIDADHHAAAVLSDAVLSWPMLTPGGLMAFDDYTWGPTLHSYDRPVTGINAFLLAYGNQLDVVERNAQLWVRKR